MANPHPVTRGRPKNRPNKVTQETVKRALEGGPLPAEQLLALGRTATSMTARFQRRIEELMADPKTDLAQMARVMGEFKEWFRLSTEANAKAAPYYSYRLAAIKVERGAPDLTRLTDDELDTLERAAGIASGARGDTNGTGSKVH